MSRAKRECSYDRFDTGRIARQESDMKKSVLAITVTLIAVSPAFAKTVKKHKHAQPLPNQTLYMQAAPYDTSKPAMMNRGMPNTAPDPFIYNYLIRSYVGTGQG